MLNEQTHYGWTDPDQTCAHEYILPEVMRQICDLYSGKPVRILDIGCGNGYVASRLAQKGHSVVAIDASHDGIDIASLSYQNVHFKVHSVYEDNLEEIIDNPVDCVLSLEVVEHLFYPKSLFKQSYRVIRPSGYLILSTPYHGYLKNLAISLMNGWDRHFRVEWDGGHIKFFSKRTLSEMAYSVGFKNPRFYGVGRFPWLWKSIIMVVKK